jgi:hypothetical protein
VCVIRYSPPSGSILEALKQQQEMEHQCVIRHPATTPLRGAVLLGTVLFACMRAVNVVVKAGCRERTYIHTYILTYISES